MNSTLARRSPVRVPRRSLFALTLAGLALPQLVAQPDPAFLAHDRTRPQPTVVDPGMPSTPERTGKAPSDAVVLFDGGNLSQWVALDGKPTQWVVKDGAMECVPGSGYIRTLRNFGDCQLHLEFAAPAKPEGSGQGRGNSGLFFGGDRYEVQVLDSFNNPTYADGSASSIYGQYPPLVNASRPPGQWQTYDVIWTAPRFEPDGKLRSPARATVIHNGVLVQNNVELTGPTAWLERQPYRAHPEKLPISLQDHGNPVRFRNVWIRELGRPGKPEFTYAESQLAPYVGQYEAWTVTLERGQLVLERLGTRFMIYAESPTKFFAKTTDVQIEFLFNDGKKGAIISVGEGNTRSEKTK